MLLHMMQSAAWTFVDLIVLALSFGIVMVLADMLADTVRRIRRQRELQRHEPVVGPGIIPIDEARKRTQVREALGG
ncbi:MAG: hypothetical protein ACYC28_15500 [Longimicrobiales bacterium]